MTLQEISEAQAAMDSLVNALNVAVQQLDTSTACALSKGVKRVNIALTRCVWRAARELYMSKEG